VFSEYERQSMHMFVDSVNFRSARKAQRNKNRGKTEEKEIW